MTLLAANWCNTVSVGLRDMEKQHLAFVNTHFIVLALMGCVFIAALSLVGVYVVKQSPTQEERYQKIVELHLIRQALVEFYQTHRTFSNLSQSSHWHRIQSVADSRFDVIKKQLHRKQESFEDYLQALSLLSPPIIQDYVQGYETNNDYDVDGLVDEWSGTAQTGIYVLDVHFHVQYSTVNPTVISLQPFLQQTLLPIDFNQKTVGWVSSNIIHQSEIVDYQNIRYLMESIFPYLIVGLFFVWCFISYALARWFSLPLRQLDQQSQDLAQGISHRQWPVITDGEYRELGALLNVVSSQLRPDIKYTSEHQYVRWDKDGLGSTAIFLALKNSLHTLEKSRKPTLCLDNTCSHFKKQDSDQRTYRLLHELVSQLQKLSAFENGLRFYNRQYCTVPSLVANMELAFESIEQDLTHGIKVRSDIHDALYLDIDMDAVVNVFIYLVALQELRTPCQHRIRFREQGGILDMNLESWVSTSDGSLSEFGQHPFPGPSNKISLGLMNKIMQKRVEEEQESFDPFDSSNTLHSSLNGSRPLPLSLGHSPWKKIIEDHGGQSYFFDSGRQGSVIRLKMPMVESLRTGGV